MEHERFENEEEQEDLVSVERVIAWGERVMSGEYSADPDEYEDTETVPVEGSTGEHNPTQGIILDMNDERRNDEEKRQLKSWIETKLGPLDSAQISGQYGLADGSTSYKVFTKPFGDEEFPWYFSEWQNEGEQPTYMLSPGWFYDANEEAGYEPI